MEITAEILVGVALILPKLRRKVTLIDDDEFISKYFSIIICDKVVHL